jgi:hypothetical protein
MEKYSIRKSRSGSQTGKQKRCFSFKIISLFVSYVYFHAESLGECFFCSVLRFFLTQVVFIPEHVFRFVQNHIISVGVTQLNFNPEGV